MLLASFVKFSHNNFLLMDVFRVFGFFSLYFFVRDPCRSIFALKVVPRKETNCFRKFSCVLGLGVETNALALGKPNWPNAKKNVYTTVIC